jgi:O-antigen/teichoic acid export membrane protein
VAPVIKKLLREDNFLSLMGNLLVALFGIAGFSLLARTLSMDDFGKWVIFITAASFIDMFRFGLSNTALIRFLSGADSKSRESFIGSNAVLVISATLIIATVIFICRITLADQLSGSGYWLFFKWYPLLSILNLPWNTATVILQADRDYQNILKLKAFNGGVFFLVVLLNTFSNLLNLEQLIYVMLLINAFTSCFSFIKGWDGLRLIMKSTREDISRLLHFGKYTMFTLVGANLLRSADTFIISISPMGTAAVALYSIPLKLTELQQIPLRSFVATAFPKMSNASLQGNKESVRNLFYTYTGALSFLFVAVGIFSFVFAEQIVWLLAGKQYLAAGLANGKTVVMIMRIFALYGLLLPLDRMTGIALDSINKPGVNALKVFYMVAANIMGDIIAVYVFHSLLFVAVGSVLFTLIGIGTGMYFLNRELELTFSSILKEGKAFYYELYVKILSLPILSKKSKLNQP